MIHEYMIRLRSGRMLFGYFDSDRDAAVHAAIAPYADTLTGAWRSLNPLRSDSRVLLMLHAAALHPSKHRAGAADISHRTTLLLDFDADCESDEMSTDEEHAAAIIQADQCSAWLVSLGWPRPTRIDSGRGCQLHVAVDLPADSSTDALVKNLLRSLKVRYSLIDTGMHDRARLARLPGFWNRKSGVSTAKRPWRKSAVVDAGDSALVSREQITAVIAKIGLPAIQTYSGTEKPNSAAVDRTIQQLAAWLDKIDVTLTEIVTLGDGRTLLRLSHCPANPDHNGSSAGIGVSVSGRPQNFCRHSSCGMPWSEWLRSVEQKHGVKFQTGRRLIFKNGATN